MSKLIINLRGGTGNQLFQAAAAASIAFTYKKNCQFCIDKLSKDKYKRKLEILPILEKLGIKERKTKNTLKTIYLDQYDIDHPLYFSKNSPLALSKHDIQLEGYFTNYRIHEQSILSKIRTSIGELEINNKFKKLEFIAIHIRELHGTGKSKIKKNIDNIGINYYSEIFKRVVNDPSLSHIKTAIIFSDNWQNPESSKLLPKIKTLLTNLGIEYIYGDDEINSPLEIINFFSLARCSIISNSTLSWWGAYLSNGKVFTPVMSLWEPDLKVPDHWEQIYSNELNPVTHHNKFIFETPFTKQEDLNLLIYNPKRILMIKIFRKLFYLIKRSTLFIILNKLLKNIGFLKENFNKTYF